MSEPLFPNNRPGPEHALETVAWHRLAWLYGYARALNICDGHDEATNADLAAWKALGASKPYTPKVVRR
jgi:hypothetical protein